MGIKESLPYGILAIFLVILLTPILTIKEEMSNRWRVLTIFVAIVSLWGLLKLTSPMLAIAIFIVIYTTFAVVGFRHKIG